MNSRFIGKKIDIINPAFWGKDIMDQLTACSEFCDRSWDELDKISQCKIIEMSLCNVAFNAELSAYIRVGDCVIMGKIAKMLQNLPRKLTEIFIGTFWIVGREIRIFRHNVKVF